MLIPSSLVRVSMMPTIQLDRELRQRAIEVEEVGTAGVLAAEFELGKAPVTEQPPEALLGHGGFLAEMPGKIPFVLRARAMFAKVLRPHSFLPLPRWGRGPE